MSVPYKRLDKALSVANARIRTERVKDGYEVWAWQSDMPTRLSPGGTRVIYSHWTKVLDARPWHWARSLADDLITILAFDLMDYHVVNGHRVCGDVVENMISYSLHQ